MNINCDMISAAHCDPSTSSFTSSPSATFPSENSSSSTMPSESESRNVQRLSTSCATSASKSITVISLPRFYQILSAMLTLLLIIPNGVNADTNARCYFFGPGMTINGADYRRDYGLSQRDCATVCKSDSCCMAFEYVDGQCTLKSRSLNGTIVPKTDAFLGLCLDFDNDDRDRFWDHELGGTIASEKPNMERDSCSEYCSTVENAVIYSWRTSNQMDMDATVGHCKCISVLHSIKLSFGSFSGFLI